MECNRGFKGVWIPASIWLDEELSLQEKVFLIEIDSLDVDGAGCWASNNHFSEFSGLSKSRCSEVISSLKKKKYLTVTYSNKNDFSERRIYIIRAVCDDDFQHSATEGVFGNPKAPVGNPKAPVEKSKSGYIESNTVNNTINSSLSEQESQTADDEKKKKYHGSPDDHMLALKMYQAILVVNQTVKEPNYDKWANTIRLMREQDGRNHSEIWHVFDYANRDQFWSNNILSPGALRRNYSKLAPRAGIVHPARVVPKEKKITDRCGQCAFSGKGKQLCAGWDTDPDHPACELFQPGKVSA